MGRGRSRQSLRLQSEVSGAVSGPGGRPGLLDPTFCPFCSQLLVMELSSTPLHICLPPASPAASPLLCGSDDGLFYFNAQLSSSSTRRLVLLLVALTEGGLTRSTPSRSLEMEITFPVYEKEDEDHDFHTIDGLSVLSDDVIGKRRRCADGETTSR